MKKSKSDNLPYSFQPFPGVVSLWSKKLGFLTFLFILLLLGCFFGENMIFQQTTAFSMIFRKAAVSAKQQEVTVLDGNPSCKNSSCSSTDHQQLSKKSKPSMSPVPKLVDFLFSLGNETKQEALITNSSLYNHRVLKALMKQSVNSSATIKKLQKNNLMQTSKDNIVNKKELMQNYSWILEKNFEENFTKWLLNETTSIATTEKPKPSCPDVPPNLQGRRDVRPSKIRPAMEDTEKLNPFVSDGGHYKPLECKAKWKVAILIPFRNRDEHLHHFLYYMHPILQRQQLDYRIYLINQFGSGKFNRAKLMNVGYVESLKDYDFQCFVFHDVDLILENDHALYNCPPKPRHLASAISKFYYSLIYKKFFGSACVLTKEQFQKVNGFSNDFWGWGGEDDDLYNRIVQARMEVIRYSIYISRYFSFKHLRDKGNEVNPKRLTMLHSSGKNMKNDGLNHLHYKVIERKIYPLYTNITVNIFAPDD